MRQPVRRDPCDPQRSSSRGQKPDPSTWQPQPARASGLGTASCPRLPQPLRQPRGPLPDTGHAPCRPSAPPNPKPATHLTRARRSPAAGHVPLPAPTPQPAAPAAPGTCTPTAPPGLLSPREPSDHDHRPKTTPGHGGPPLRARCPAQPNPRALCATWPCAARRHSRGSPPERKGGTPHQATQAIQAPSPSVSDLHQHLHVSLSPLSLSRSLLSRSPSPPSALTHTASKRGTLLAGQAETRGHTLHAHRTSPGQRAHGRQHTACGLELAAGLEGVGRAEAPHPPVRERALRTEIPLCHEGCRGVRLCAPCVGFSLSLCVCVCVCARARARAGGGGDSVRCHPPSRPAAPLGPP